MNNNKYLKKIISFAVIAFSIACLCACTDDAPNDPDNKTVSDPDDDWILMTEPRMTSLVRIENEDAFENRYYEYFFDYEEEYDIVYQLNVKAEFRRLWDYDTDWKVYVSDRKLGNDYIEYMIENNEPTLVNEGELEIHSGQWIYFYCEHNSSNSDKPNKAGCEIYYYGLPSSIAMTPEMEFENYMVTNLGLPADLGYHTCDVTGDGYDDFCTCRMYGSGMVRIQCVVYDAKMHDCYVLDGYNYDYSIVEVKDGKLILEESGPNGYGDPIIKTVGTAEIEDGQLVFVKEMSERDIRDLGDFSEDWVEEKLKEVKITSAEEIEYVRWVDDEKNALQIGIRFEWPGEDRYTDHKRDIFVFKDAVKPLSVVYSVDEAGGQDRMVFADPTFEAHFEDVNFDGSDELIIQRGTNGMSSMVMYSAYELKDDEYVFFPAFEWIYSYTVNLDDRTIECVRTSGDSENKTYITTYTYEDGKYYKTGETVTE